MPDAFRRRAKRKGPLARALSFCRFILSRQATEPPAFSIFPRPARLAEPTLTDPNRLYSTLPRLFAIAPPKAGAALLPRTEMARRPPEAGNRAHIPRAIASREAMLWQGCSLSPRELERKAPRSVWATQLPASRPIRWIVRESREANRTDSPASHRTDFAPHPARPRTDSHSESPRPLSHGRTAARLSATSSTIQPLYIRFPTPPQPSETSTPPQPSFSRLSDDSALGKNPRLNHPSCRIQERFRLNHPTSVILQLRLNHNHNHNHNKTGARQICRAPPFFA